MSQLAVTTLKQWLRSVVSLMLAATGAWIVTSLPAAPVLASPAAVPTSGLDHAGSSSAYDYCPDFVRPPPGDSRSATYDTSAEHVEPAADGSRVRRAFSGLGFDSVAPTSAADDLLSAACRTNSFIPGTEVLMANGTTKPIEEVGVGDWVLATDPETGEAGPRRVIDTIIGEGSKQLVHVEVAGDTVTATGGHPFWVDDRGRWVDAGELETDDRLLLADGSTAGVTAVQDRFDVLRVHNLTVEDIHTYHVVTNDSTALVHNCLVDELGGLAGDFDADELAQFAYKHAGEGDFVSTPTVDQISDALTTQGTRLPDQNAVRFQSSDTVVITNEDSPCKGTAHVSGGG